MAPLFNILYLIIFLIFLVGSLIVVFHFIRYSYNKATTTLMLTIFLATMGFLIFTNVALFASINFDRAFLQY